MAEEFSRCRYGDPTCPCNDGDACHYEGERPLSIVQRGPAAGMRAGPHRRAMMARQEPARVDSLANAPRDLA